MPLMRGRGRAGAGGAGSWWREEGARRGDDRVRIHALVEELERDELGGDGGVHAVAGKTRDLQEHAPAAAGLAPHVPGEARDDDLRTAQRARALATEGALED